MANLFNMSAAQANAAMMRNPRIHELMRVADLKDLAEGEEQMQFHQYQSSQKITSTHPRIPESVLNNELTTGLHLGLALK